MTPLPQRMAELSALEDGWLDGLGKALPRDGLSWFFETWLAPRIADGRLPHPYIYPTEGGGLSLEWSRERWEIGLEIDLFRRTGEAMAVDVSSPPAGRIEAKWLDDADLSTDAGSEAAVAFLRPYLNTPTR